MCCRVLPVFSLMVCIRPWYLKCHFINPFSPSQLPALVLDGHTGPRVVSIDPSIDSLNLSPSGVELRRFSTAAGLDQYRTDSGVLRLVALSSSC